MLERIKDYFWAINIYLKISIQESNILQNLESFNTDSKVKIKNAN